jgi:hypothetical protein
MSLNEVKAFYLFLSMIFPLTVGAQNTNSEKLKEEQSLNLNQIVNEFEDWQKEQIKELKPKAEQGDAAAQCDLGQMLLYHRAPVPEPPEPNPEGIKWLRKAAEQGYLQAQLTVASLLKLSPDTDTELVRWLRAAADQGSVAAKFELGTCYEEGKIVPKDYSEAAKLYLQAAEQGHQLAQTQLAVLYSEGKGVPRSLKEAYVWEFIARVFGGRPTTLDIEVLSLAEKKSAIETEALVLAQKNEQKLAEPALAGDELADAQKEAVLRLVEIAKRINATKTAE